MGHFHDTLKDANRLLMEGNFAQVAVVLARHKKEAVGERGATEASMTELQKIEMALRFYRNDLDMAMVKVKAHDKEKAQFYLMGAINNLSDIKEHIKHLVQKDKKLKKAKIKLE